MGARRSRRIVAIAAAIVSLSPVSLQASPSPGGFSSDNVTWVKHVPFDVATATGLRVVGGYAYLTSWRHFSIYDLSDPLDPELLSTTPFGYKFENEDVSTNGEILLFSEQSPGNALHVWNVEDKANPTLVASLEGAGNHTMTCILRCAWAYGSSGDIVDLRDPSTPKIAGDWATPIHLHGGAHDVEEVKPGFVLTSPISQPLQYLDVRDPLHPKVLASGVHPAPSEWIFHSGKWPNAGRDDFLIMEGEGDDGPVLTYATKGWQRTRSFRLLDSYHVEQGTIVDGRWPAPGVSSHWFDTHPRFADGGLIAAGWYNHGARFLRVDSKGELSEVGHFLPHAGSTFATYWITDEIVYNVDNNRGIDILQVDWKTMMQAQED